MKQVIDLYKKNKEVINYLFFGGVTTVICLLVYYALTFTVLDPDVPICLQIANIISWIVGVTVAYITNRKYVFNSKNPNVRREVKNFVIARLLTLVLDMLIMGIGVTVLRFNDKILKIISQILVIVSNYVLSKLFVFNKK